MEKGVDEVEGRSRAWIERQTDSTATVDGMASGRLVMV